MPDTIRMLELRFFTLVGDLPHERTTPQPLEVDVEARVDLSAAGRSDRLEDAIDYRRIHERVVEGIERHAGDAPHLLETVAERVAERVLELDGVMSVRVRCRKPQVVLPGPVGKVEIEIERP